MAERLEHHPESNETLTPRVEREPSKETAHHEKRHETHHIKEELETITHKVEAEAKSGKELKVDKNPEQKQHHIVTKELKDESFKRTMQRTRKQLSKPERTLSKAIHQPVINAVSKVGEKTIARPTGILTGALVALIGSTYVLWTAKHYGYEYNYWIVFALFVGGYLVGLVIETLVYMLRRLRGAK
jgi:hypothetical protein